MGETGPGEGDVCAMAIDILHHPGSNVGAAFYGLNDFEQVMETC